MSNEPQTVEQPPDGKLAVFGQFASALLAASGMIVAIAYFAGVGIDVLILGVRPRFDGHFGGIMEVWFAANVVALISLLYRKGQPLNRHLWVIALLGVLFQVLALVVGWPHAHTL